MQPLTNKYTRWYQQLVQNRRTVPLSKQLGYCENHHVIPECLGGTNTKDNMVLLTAREHFVAHLLLTKMYKGAAKKKMHYAFYSMRRKKEGMERYEPNSNIYEILVRKIDRTPTCETREKMRQSQKKREAFPETHKKNIARGVTASYTPELRAVRSGYFRGRLPSDVTRAKMSNAKTGMKRSDTSRAKQSASISGESHWRAMSWRLMSPNGEVFETSSIVKFCKERGLAYSAFRNKRSSGSSQPIGKGASQGWCLLLAVYSLTQE